MSHLGVLPSFPSQSTRLPYRLLTETMEDSHFILKWAIVIKDWVYMTYAFIKFDETSRHDDQFQLVLPSFLTFNEIASPSLVWADGSEAMDSTVSHGY